MTARLAVFGHPVGHSRSPWIHARFGRDAGIELEYSAEDVAPARFDTTIARFFAAGARGANVTVPHKAAAHALADRLDEAAAEAGAVNTFVPTDQGLLGCNTDGSGLLRDLDRLAAPVAGAHVLVLGAGGAVLGVLGPLLRRQPASIRLCNRTRARAEDAVARFAGIAAAQRVELQAATPETSRADRPFALVLNGTSASLEGTLPALAPGHYDDCELAYDLAYGSDVFTSAAVTAGARRAEDGLGMLVEQAADAFLLWFGDRPETRRVLEDLRNEIAVKDART